MLDYNELTDDEIIQNILSPKKTEANEFYESENDPGINHAEVEI